MKGIELSKAFFEEYGKPMLQAQFGDVLSHITAGLCGEGSECLGFDDGFSVDHDFEPGFCLFISEEDERLFGFALERAYAKLPKEFRGYRRSPLSPVGGNRHGVISTEAFYKRYLGDASAPDTPERWLYTPSFSLLAASNGALFLENPGTFTEIRGVLKKGYPEDIRKKKVAAHLALAAQSGQYNYFRCKARNEEGGAVLCLNEFVRHVLSLIYLLNNTYEPFYKWAFRGLDGLTCLSVLKPLLLSLVQHPSDVKEEQQEEICAHITEELNLQGLSASKSLDLERQGYAVQNTIEDVFLRTMHVMEGI